MAGLVLLVAGGLKGHALAYTPLAAGSPLLTRQAEFMLVVGELVLGVWLLTCWQRPLAWLAAMASFLGFASASAWLAWQGHSSCGCFGKVEASPWFALALDLTVLLVLLPGFPRPHEWRGVFQSRRWQQVGVSVMGLSLAGTAAWFILPLLGYNHNDLLARWRGERLIVLPSEVDVGAGPPGPGQPFVVSLHNISQAPIRIVGGTSDCGCLATSDLPLTLQAGEQRDLRIVFKRSGVPGLFKRGYWFYTDDARQPFVVAWFSGRTLPTPTKPAPSVAMPTAMQAKPDR